MGDCDPGGRGEESHAGGRSAAQEVHRHPALHHPELPHRGPQGENSVPKGSGLEPHYLQLKGLIITIVTVHATQ